MHGECHRNYNISSIFTVGTAVTFDLLQAVELSFCGSAGQCCHCQLQRLKDPQHLSYVII